jgi:hypothetical protein
MNSNKLLSLPSLQPQIRPFFSLHIKTIEPHILSLPNSHQITYQTNFKFRNTAPIQNFPANCLLHKTMGVWQNFRKLLNYKKLFSNINYPNRFSNMAITTNTLFKRNYKTLLKKQNTFHKILQKKIKGKYSISP